MQRMCKVEKSNDVQEKKIQDCLLKYDWWGKDLNIVIICTQMSITLKKKVDKQNHNITHYYNQIFTQKSECLT